MHSRPAPKPSTGAWTGNSIDVTASATDNAGLASLKFFGNGTQFAQVTCSGTTCGSTQWWLTGSLPSGKHTITVVATDTAGNSTTSAPVVITRAVLAWDRAVAAVRRRRSALVRRPRCSLCMP